MKSRVLVWILCSIISASILIKIGIDFANHEAYGSPAVFANLVGSSLIPIVFAVTAALIMSRQPRNAIGWLLMIPAVAMAIAAPIDSFFAITTNPAPNTLVLLMAWYSGWAWILLIFPFFHIPMLFPTGKPLSTRWRWVSIITIIWASIFVLGATFSMNLGEISGNSFPNPFGLISIEVFESWLRFWFPGLLVITVLSVTALILRYRRSSKLERMQINWLLFSCMLFTMVYLLIGVLDLGDSQTFAGYLTGVLFGLTLMLVPISIAIAILRYHLWDIDVIIRRTLVYSILTVLLALVYFGGVTLLQGLFSRFTGEQSSAAIVLSTLSIAALFNPLHTRIRSFIDRRFYRSRYDSEKTLASFSAHLREEVNLDDLRTHITSVVEETFQPAHVSVFLLSSPSAATAGNSYMRLK